jgi:two-component system sensor histidine kinase AlgZ
METTLPTIGTSAQRLVPTYLEDRISQDVGASINPSTKSDRSFGNILTTVLSWNFAATVLALLFEATFHSDAPPGQIDFVDSFIYSNCIGMLVGFAVFGFTPRLVLRRFPFNWVLLVSMILSLTFVGSLIAGFILMGLGIFPPHDYGWISLRRMGLGFLLALVFGISGYLYEGVRLRLKATTEQLRTKVLEEERAQKLAVEASLSSLESRVHPHFLFNTLNSISSLIQEDPLLAERMVERLAALLRFSLDSSHRSTIPLEQELKIAVDYLEIEKARFGERLHYDIDIPAELNSMLVPPFVIQTLVENSVKHAVSLKREGGSIHLKATVKDGRVNIEVGDDGPGFSADAITAGHGLDNLRARLMTLFAHEAALDLSRPNGFMVVNVSLPDNQQVRSDAA